MSTTIDKQHYSEAVKTARDYYNSEDADAFYSKVWGGQNIHIGLYEDDQESIADASHRSVLKLAEKLEPLGPGNRIIDLGSGYGGTARHLAKSFGCHVSGLNLSDVENQRARRLNEESGLQENIDIIDGSFESIPIPDSSFDAAYSQDAMLHSGDRLKVITEVTRVLKPGGVFVFADIMQANLCPNGALQPILDRIKLSSLGSLTIYREAAQACSLIEEQYEDLTPHLITHYARVLEHTDINEDKLKSEISPGYIQAMKEGLARWVDGGHKNYLEYGMFVFRKPANE